MLDHLQELDTALASDVVIAEEELSELQRQARAAPHRRGGPGSRDAQKYRLGSSLWLYGFEHFDPQELTGILAHPILLLLWVGEIALRAPKAPLGELLDEALSDPARASFCKQWGRVIEWRYRKELYNEEIRSFERSGKTGANACWRKEKPSKKQEALISTLCDVLELADPCLKTKGDAYEWIREHGGNPSFWEEPPLPPEWEIFL